MPFITLTMVHPKKLKVGPCLVNTDHVRAAYPRHYEPGTRLTFRDGRGVAVLDKFADVCAMLGSPGRAAPVQPLGEPSVPAGGSIADAVKQAITGGASIQEAHARAQAAFPHRLVALSYVKEIARKFNLRS